VAPGSRCNGTLLEMWPILPKASKLAYPNNLILKYFEENHKLFRIFFDSVPPLPVTCGALVN